MKMTSASVGTSAALKAVFVAASCFHFAASVQPYGANFAVAAPGAPVVDNAFEVTRFGPAGCVSTWKNQASHCVIRTECTKQSLMEYNIRLLCIDKGNERVRHVFGKGSFDPAETFDTLVVCDQCTAEEAIPPPQPPGPAPAPASAAVEQPTGPVASFAAAAEVAKLSATVQTLSSEVHDLTVSMASNTAAVNRLENAVFGAGSQQGAAQAPSIQAVGQPDAAQTPPVASPTQADSSGVATQTPVMVAPTQAEAAAATLAPATEAPSQVQALARWGNATVGSKAGRRPIVLKKRRLVKQQQQQAEENAQVIDDTDPKPSQQQDDAEDEVRGQAGSFAVSQDSSEENGDSQMDNEDQVMRPEYDSDNTDQAAEEQDWANDGNEDNQDEQE